MDSHRLLSSLSRCDVPLTLLERALPWTVPSSEEEAGEGFAREAEAKRRVKSKTKSK